MNRLTKKEFEWYDDFVTSIEDEYDIDETNDVMYRNFIANSVIIFYYIIVRRVYYPNL